MESTQVQRLTASELSTASNVVQTSFIPTLAGCDLFHSFNEIACEY